MKILLSILDDKKTLPIANILLFYLNENIESPDLITDSLFKIMDFLKENLYHPNLIIVYFTIRAYRNVILTLYNIGYSDNVQDYFDYLFDFFNYHTNMFIKIKIFNIIQDLWSQYSFIAHHFEITIITIISDYSIRFDKLIKTDDDLHIIYVFTNVMSGLCSCDKDINLPVSLMIPTLIKTMDKLRLFNDYLKYKAYILITLLILYNNQNVKEKITDFDLVPILYQQINLFMEESRKDINVDQYCQYSIIMNLILTNGKIKVGGEHDYIGEYFRGIIYNNFDLIWNYSEQPVIEHSQFPDDYEKGFIDVLMLHTLIKKKVYASLIRLMKNFKKQSLKYYESIVDKLSKLYEINIQRRNKEEDYEDEEYYILECFTHLIELLVENGTVEDVYDVWEGTGDLKGKFFEAIKNYKESDQTNYLYLLFYECLNKLKYIILNPEEIEKLGDILNEKITNMIIFFKEITTLKKTNEGEYDELIKKAIKLNTDHTDQISLFIRKLSKLYQEKLTILIEMLFDNLVKQKDEIDYLNWTTLALVLYSNIAENHKNLESKYDFVFTELKNQFYASNNERNIRTFSFYCVVVEFQVTHRYKLVLDSISFLKTKTRFLHDNGCLKTQIDYYDHLIEIYAKYLYFAPELFPNLNDEIKNYISLLPIKSNYFEFNLKFMIKVLEEKFDLLYSLKSDSIMNLVFSIMIMLEHCDKEEIVFQIGDKMMKLRVFIFLFI